jgi:MFS family permease
MSLPPPTGSDDDSSKENEGAPAGGGEGVRHDPYAAWRHRNYRLFISGAFLTIIGRQMLTVAVSWEVYEMTGSATALGLIGLLYAIPLLVLALPAGQLADRFNRKGIVFWSLLALAVLSLGLALVSGGRQWIPDLPVLASVNNALRALALFLERRVEPEELRFDDPALPLIFLILFLMAVVRICSNPARAALLPGLIPLSIFSNAVTWNSSMMQIASISGPAIGGFLIAGFGFAPVYLLDAGCSLAMVLLLVPVRYQGSRPVAETKGWGNLLAGIRFVWRKQVILAAIALDMFAVLLGGVTALLPIFADRILDVGPVGLGWLRAAPALGAFVMALSLAHLPPMKRPGILLLWSVAGFGLANVLFGFSNLFWLSLLLLFFTGLFDNISVVIRHSLVQLLTPDAMRGRVSAVNQVFIGSSNELGAARAGFMAALLGPVLAVVLGGVGTLLVVAAAARAWPEVRRLKSLHQLKPDEEEKAD